MDIDRNNIRQLDVSMLVIFHELIQHRKTTLVASRVGLSQSAISHALKRLRLVFGDPLFIRHSDGMEPTARALEIASEIATVLETLRLAVNSGSQFNAATSRRLFRIASNDFIGAFLVGPMIADFKLQTPKVRLVTHFGVGAQSLEALRREEIDLAIGRIYTLPDGFTAIPLFEEGFAVVARKDHPKLKRTLGLDTYLALDHLLVSFRGGVSGIVDRTLERRGLKRRVTASVPMFMTAFAAVSTSDVIATVPARLARSYATSFGLRIFKPPLSIEPFPIIAVRHVRKAKDQGVDWLIERIRLVLKSV